MSSSTKRVRAALIATGLTVLLGAACGAGVSGGGGGDAQLQAAPAANVERPATPVTEAPPPTQAPDTTVPVTAAPPTTKTTAAADKAAPVPVTEAQPAPTAPPATSAPTPTTATTPPSTVPARPNVSSTQVQTAISQFKSRIAFFAPTEAQARQFGDMVCSAFDGGQSYAQVKAAVIAKVQTIPLISVSSADADYILGITVRLFCPAYASKLP